MTWIRLTIHWIVNDSDLRKVSVYTPHTYACGWMRMCVEFQDEILFVGGGNVKPRENLI